MIAHVASCRVLPNARARAPASTSARAATRVSFAPLAAPRRAVARPARLPLAPRAEGGDVETKTADAKEVNVDKEISKNARKIASTFAPRSSTAKKNPAFKGSTLYTIFEVQAYLSLVVGALLSYNVLLPSDEPDIARLMGMWSVWMFAVPSLRARECDAKEKDALNFLFIAIPLINVLIPVFWKSFSAVFTADCLLMAYMYYNKGAGIFDDGSAAAGEAETEPAAEDSA